MKKIIAVLMLLALALNIAALAEGDIQTQRSGRDRLNVHIIAVLAQTHDRTCAEIFFDLFQSRLKRFGSGFLV